MIFTQDQSALQDAARRFSRWSIAAYFERVRARFARAGAFEERDFAFSIQGPMDGLSRRSRLEHWLLLVLRCLALALLALGFARPFFKQAPLLDPTTAQPKRTVVLVDLSASMRRAGLWSEARDRVTAAIRRAAPCYHRKP